MGIFQSIQTCITEGPDLSDEEDNKSPIDPDTIGYHINRKSTYAGLQTYCNYTDNTVQIVPKGIRTSKWNKKG
jgi:hypothetical protein